MTVTALLFARYRAQAGADRLQLELAPGATARDAAGEVSRRTGVPLAGAMCAINERYAPPETSLGDGDRVAFLPPVSGG